MFHLGFSHFLGIGPMKFQSLKLHFQSVENAYLANKNQLEPILGFKLTEKFIEFRKKFDPQKEIEKLQKNGITILTVVDEDYPDSLKNISDSPICIYLKGNATIFNIQKRKLLGKKSNASDYQIFFGIVGTRKPTSYGQQIARKFSHELAETGFIIVSGMAMGIDTIAHQSALDIGAKTIAVLGCGVNIIYPAINRYLYERIIKTGSAVISEFPPNQTVLKGLFISRNRIISGLSKGVLVVEGGENSGALITAKHAGIQGKDVFAVPSSINSDMSKAPNLLIKQGAKLVTRIEDIYEEFNMRILPKRVDDVKKILSEKERLIFDILQENPQTIDDVAIKLNKTVSEILNIISMMEIKGTVEKNQENKYQIII